MHNTKGHESNRQLFVHMGGDISLLQAAPNTEPTTKDSDKEHSETVFTWRPELFMYCGNRAVSGRVGTPRTLMSTVVSVKHNVLMYINTGKGCFSGKQAYSSHLRYNLKTSCKHPPFKLSEGSGSQTEGQGKVEESDGAFSDRMWCVMEHVTGDDPSPLWSHVRRPEMNLVVQAELVCSLALGLQGLNWQSDD